MSARSVGLVHQDGASEYLHVHVGVEERLGVGLQLLPVHRGAASLCEAVEHGLHSTVGEPSVVDQLVGEPGTATAVIALKQAVNGIACALVASAAATHVAALRRLAGDVDPASVSLRDTLFHLFVALAMAQLVRTRP